MSDAGDRFEVWVDGGPLMDAAGQVLRFPEREARRRADRLNAQGRRAVLVPDQSKRPPDEELR